MGVCAGCCGSGVVTCSDCDGDGCKWCTNSGEEHCRQCDGKGILQDTIEDDKTKEHLNG